MPDKVIQHPYRTAIVGEHFMHLPRSACREMEKHLAQQAGTKPDNHTVYEVVFDAEFGTQEVTYIFFTDTSVIFGRRIVKKKH